MSFVVLVHAAATAVLAGIAWTVQLVVYPSFALVPPAAWPRYHARHTSRIAAVLAVPWIAQGATTVVLLAGRHTDPGRLLPADAVLAVLPVLVTLPAARLHARPARLRAPATRIRLLRLNLLRCLLWLAGTGTALGLVVRA